MTPELVCFIAAPEKHPNTASFRESVDAVVQRADNRPIRCVVEAGELGRAVDRAEAVLMAINRADFAILLFDGTDSDLTLALGMVLALGKPILFVRACRLSELPSSLVHRYWVEFSETKEGKADFQVALQAFFTSVAQLASGERRLSDNCVFICHRSTDKPQVGRVAASLLGLGYHVWYDSWSILAGDAIVKEIHFGLGQATHFLIFLSANTAGSSWVTQELEVAVKRALDEGQPRIIPVFLDPVGRKETPLMISGRKGISMHTLPAGAAISALIDAIEQERQTLDAKKREFPNTGF